MRKALAANICAIFFLSSCAAKFEAAQYQSCRSSTPTFSEYGNCLKAALHRGKGAPKDARLKEFFGEIDRLTAEVEAERLESVVAYNTIEQTRQRLRVEEERENKRTAAILIGAAALGAAAYAASKGGGGGGYGGQTEEGFAWDRIDAPDGGLQWRCRDKSNGRFAYDYQCAGEVKVDSTWPGT